MSINTPINLKVRKDGTGLLSLTIVSHHPRDLDKVRIESLMSSNTSLLGLVVEVDALMASCDLPRESQDVVTVLFGGKYTDHDKDAGESLFSVLVNVTSECCRCTRRINVDTSRV